MRIAAPCLVSLGLLLGIALGVSACFDDPPANDDESCALGEEGCSCLQNATCFGNLECVQGVCLSDGETGDGDGDPGDGDGDPGDGDGDGDSGEGDGDGEAEENVVVDLFAEACGVTTTWTEHTPEPAAIACDQAIDGKGGQMVRYPSLQIGDDSFEKVIGLTAPLDIDNEVRGLFNLDDVPNVLMLEFRAEVMLRCANGDLDCTGRFALAIAEGTQGGLYSVYDDRELASGMAPIEVVDALTVLQTLSEPSIGLAAIQTDADSENPPEVLIINPRLVLP